MPPKKSKPLTSKPKGQPRKVMVPETGGELSKLALSITPEDSATCFQSGMSDEVLYQVVGLEELGVEVVRQKVATKQLGWHAAIFDPYRIQQKDLQEEMAKSIEVKPSLIPCPRSTTERKCGPTVFWFSQTRSGDEGMSMTVTCKGCGWRKTFA
jgi:DNA-directed RNA polymerase subunit M/transcription elongation factor TFIIS